MNINKPWTEKYRPKTLNDISYHHDVTSILKNSLKNKNISHLLFHGSAGVGKTSTILAMCNDFYGSKEINNNVLELNASDDRGIDVVRTKIKDFSKLSIKKTMNSSFPPFKIIILDEVDSMTNHAQSALRRIMELYSDVTRFCLICNDVSKIITPIISRCAKFFFKSLNILSVHKSLAFIAKSENININNDIISKITDITKGDMRRAITLLQSLSYFNINEITEEHLYVLSFGIKKDYIDNLIQTAYSRNYNVIKSTIENIMENGYSASQIFVLIMEEFINKDLNDTVKARICNKIAIAENNLNEKADEYLQLYDVFIFINELLIDTNK